MRLWSTVVIQDQSPLRALNFVPGMYAACGAMEVLLFQAQEIGGERLGLLAPHAQVRHQHAGLHVARVLDPLGQVLRRVRQQVGAHGLAAAEVRQVGPQHAARDARDRVAAPAGGPVGGTGGRCWAATHFSKSALVCTMTRKRMLACDVPQYSAHWPGYSPGSSGASVRRLTRPGP